MAKVNLTKVVQMAFHNEKFHRALVRNAEGALKRVKMSLSAADMRKLKKLLKSRSVAKDFKHYKRLHKQYRLKKPSLGVLW